MKAVREAPPIRGTKARQPWERQPAEGDGAWAAFAVYRDLPPIERSLARAGEKIGKGKRQLEDWCSRHGWVARARAWDVEVDRQARLAAVAEIRKMRERHVRGSMTLQALGFTEAGKLLTKSQARTKAAQMAGTVDEPMLEVDEVARVAELGMKVERLNRGEPGEIEEQRIVPDAEPSAPLHDYSRLSRDELRQLKSIVSKARRGQG